MAVTLTLVGKTPGQSQFAMDQFTEHYKTDSAADVVLTDPGVIQIGAAHPDYPFMFVNQRHCAETGERASALDIVFLGCMRNDGEGGPLLPEKKASSSAQVASATSNTSSLIFPRVATNPTTVTFYSITNTVTFISNNIADAFEPDDPPTITGVITWDLGFGVQPGISNPDLIALLLNDVFVQAITETPPDIQPVVRDQYWQITKRKTRTLQPYGPAS